ncbi:MAG: hypothetical protein K1X91_14920 [Bacteriodetes bacterium]|nr:hypothetical protein [Bacteroidota bacterium]
MATKLAKKYGLNGVVYVNRIKKVGLARVAWFPATAEARHTAPSHGRSQPIQRRRKISFTVIKNMLQ